MNTNRIPRWVRVVALHLCGWLIYSLLTLFQNWDRLPDLPTRLLHTLGVDVGMALIYYPLAFFLKKWLNPRSWPWAVLAIVLLWLFAIPAAKYFVYNLLPRGGIVLYRKGHPFTWSELAVNISLILARVLILAVLIEVVRRYIAALLHKIRLLLERDSLRDSLLRFKIGPHFIFGLLNSLKSNALVNQDGLVAAAIDEYAPLNRYIMECAEGNLSLISATREVAQLERLVRLANLLYREEAIRLEINGSPTAQVLPPAILLTLVENILKHGAPSITRPATIRVDYRSDGFAFEATNIVVHGPDAGARNTSSGHGIQNVRERLNILMPGKHRFNISTEGNTFKATLFIRMA